MTFLIGTLSDRHALITADGLSQVNPITGSGEASLAYQKIFPVPDFPIAFAHHGFNILRGKQILEFIPIREFIQEYVSSQYNKLVGTSIKDIAEDFRSYAEKDAEEILSEPTNKDGVVGFWIAGFGGGERRPQLYEVCWPNKPAPRQHEMIVFGGDAKEFVKQYLEQPFGRFDPRCLSNYSVNEVSQYHSLLYQRAESEQRKTGKTIFGGHKHQLLLEKSGWRWTKAPK